MLVFQELDQPRHRELGQGLLGLRWVRPEAQLQRRVAVDVSDIITTTKPVELLKQVIRLSADEDSIILDSFAGSGTTAHAVLALNQRQPHARKTGDRWLDESYVFCFQRRGVELL